MFQPWEHIETFDLHAWSKHAGGVAFQAPRALQILFALVAEIQPRSALQMGAYTADGAVVLIAALNAGFIEEAHFVAAAPSDHFRGALTHARLSRHVHTYSTAPVVIQADCWIVDGGDRQAVDRAIENAPAIIAAIPPGSETWSATGYRVYGNNDVRIGINSALVDDDTAELARDLVATDRVWWSAKEIAL